MSLYRIWASTLTNIAQAIRNKMGIEDEMTVAEMIGYLYPYPSIEADHIMMTFQNGEELVTRSDWSNLGDLDIIENRYLSSIPSYTFRGNTNLQKVNFLGCKAIGMYAFSGCNQLTDAIFENCETISDQAFMQCSNLSNISFPKCKTVAGWAFGSCSVDQLSELNVWTFPTCESIGFCGFGYNQNLSEIYCPKCITIDSAAFFSDKNLKKAHFDNCKEVIGNAFHECSSLVDLYMPMCESFGQAAFWGCPFKKLDFYHCSFVGNAAFRNCSQLYAIGLYNNNLTIASGAFSGCGQLVSVYLPIDSVPTLMDSNAFTNTPLIPVVGESSYTNYGRFYIPASLNNAYQTATNWRYFSACFSYYTDDEISAIREGTFNGRA